jgi:hypothetical protein
MIDQTRHEFDERRAKGKQHNEQSSGITNQTTCNMKGNKPNTDTTFNIHQLNSYVSCTKCATVLQISSEK